MRFIRFLLLLFVSLYITSAFAAVGEAEVNSDSQLETRVSNLENRVSGLDSDFNRRVKDAGPGGLVLFLFGAFCALWAQNTGRSAWLWFFLGLFLNFIAVLILLEKNSDENFARRGFGRTPRESPSELTRKS